MAKQALDPERRAAILAAVQAEEQRRRTEWVRERIDAGRVVQLIAEPGESAAERVRRHRIENPDDDSLILLRVFYDAPPLRPDPPTEPVEPVPNPWAEHVDRELLKPIRYPDRGWM